MRWIAKDDANWRKVWAWFPIKVEIDGRLRWVWWEYVEMRPYMDATQVRAFKEEIDDR